MRRNVISLGASVIALALAAGPASAASDAIQAVDDSAGTAQVGPVAVDAPVRVLSDGESAATGVSAGAPQTTNESTGAAQVGAVEANAPVRVLSDGDDSGSAGSASAPDQSTSDSTGAVSYTHLTLPTTPYV